MIYEVVIGVEVHAQLRTKSKLFCGCGTMFGLTANSQTCPLCLGLPGTLPVLNQVAVEMAVRAGLALNCTIAANNLFARKNYFYPDLPKGYQISQYEAPICEHGWIEIAASEGTRRVRIRRAHLEEDAGKSVHVAGTNGSRVDLNRAGTPLLEIVTEPDLRSADEVVAYLKGLRDVLMYLEVCDGNMDEGSFRCEPNLSLRPLGQKEFWNKGRAQEHQFVQVRQRCHRIRDQAPDKGVERGRQDQPGDPPLESRPRRDGGDALQRGGARLSVLPRPRSGAAQAGGGMDRGLSQARDRIAGSQNETICQRVCAV